MSSCRAAAATASSTASGSRTRPAAERMPSRSALGPAPAPSGESTASRSRSFPSSRSSPAPGSQPVPGATHPPSAAQATQPRRARQLRSRTCALPTPPPRPWRPAARSSDYRQPRRAQLTRRARIATATLQLPDQSPVTRLRQRASRRRHSGALLSRVASGDRPPHTAVLLGICTRPAPASQSRDPDASFVAIALTRRRPAWKRLRIVPGRSTLSPAPA